MSSFKQVSGEGKVVMSARTRTRAKTRASRRGAAFVEAAIIMPVMVGFLGFMYWFHDLHKAKQTAMNQVRAATLTHASNACGGAGNAGNDGSASGSINSGAKGGAAESASGVGSKLNMVFKPYTAAATPVQAKGFGAGGGPSAPWRRTLNANSACMCNEPHVPDGISGILSFAKNVFSEGSPF